MGKTRALLVSFNNELTKQLQTDRSDVNRQIGEINARLDAISQRTETRLENIAQMMQSRLDDIYKAVEVRHADMWKLLNDMNNSLPMSVSMSASEVLDKFSNGIKADIADSRQEIVGRISRISDGND
jgi:hypothetical protein